MPRKYIDKRRFPKEAKIAEKRESELKARHEALMRERVQETEQREVERMLWELWKEGRVSVTSEVNTLEHGIVPFPITNDADLRAAHTAAFGPEGER